MVCCGCREMTPEEQKAAEEKKALIAKAKARGAEKAKLTKSMIIMDVKPWDDTTGAAVTASPYESKPNHVTVSSDLYSG